MLQKTRGIVFKNTVFAESSVISKIYTEDFGWQSFMINGVRKKKSKSSGLVQPLTILEMVIYLKENRSIQKINELKYAYIYKEIPFDIIKSSIGIFMLEVLYKVVAEHEANPALFEFVFDQLIKLDKTQDKIVNYHLYFLLELSKYIGLAPNNNYTDHRNIFDLSEGSFFETAKNHSHLIYPPASKLFHLLLKEDKSLELNNTDRKELLQALIKYFELHIEGFKLKTTAIFTEVLS